jgi:hypothetical protein
MCDPGLESGLSVFLAGSYVERSIGKGVNPVKDGAYWKVVKSLGRCPWKELMWFWLDQLVPKRVGSYKKKKKKKQDWALSCFLSRHVISPSPKPVPITIVFTIL